ncbi:VWA domain-containing protein [Gallaecimonas xiamenensis]|uniref:von Willebrand factor A n=1 Tax=Gallaecimonas xiamenensis 3-C-1 TaxID=745411 RepID=K2J2X3_9GAMM|nr:VWA domain-containing protein [Gallaecimonas xiamenensis]EKE69463.1 von Willebrand factor A [Gallaecimonas xiamenensis 3-C-1]
MAEQLKERWRLVLGRYADSLGANLSGQQLAQDQVLEQLYAEGQRGRGLKVTDTLEDNVGQWLENAEALFPRSVNDQLQQHALERFDLHQLLQQPGMLDKVSPSLGLLKQLMKLNAHHNLELRQRVEAIIRAVVEELLRLLRPKITNTLAGRRNRQAHSPVKRLANLDWQTTIRRNLKHFDGEKLRYERVYFHARRQTQLPWHVVLCIDQSGSMAESMIYSAVIAGIITRLPSVRLSLVVFDTKLMDLSDHAQDPVTVLLKCQMGGGTHIANAWRYCQQLAQEPGRTLVATVSDFDEGGPQQALFSQAKDMIDSGITMMGLTALTADSQPFYDSHATAQLQRLGMEVSALSPDRFAQRLAKIMGLR